QMRPGLDRQPNLESSISASLHIPFPFGIARKTRLAIAGVTGRGRSAFGAPADREALEQLAIESHVELLRPPHAHEGILVLPPQGHLDQILTVGRKVVVNREAAARSERQILTLPVVLDHMQRNLERFELYIVRRKTHRKPRDLAGHCK